MYKYFFKRFFDFWISLIGIVILSPLLLIVMILLYFTNDDAGVFFFQERPGKDEKIFKIIKFKTMTDKRDAAGCLLPDKDRITKIGRIIRKLSIDELPQLINVLKGDMAFIGPRPLLPEYIPWYTERERLRHTVRPGMSGLAQVNGRNNLSWDEKLSFDVYYVEHLTFWMDVKVIFKTIVNVLRHKNVNIIPGMRLGKLNVVREEERKNNPS